MFPFVVAAWIVGIIHAVSQFVFVINLPFRGPNEVDNFYCDFPRVMKLACVDTYKLEFVIIANSGFVSMATFSSNDILYLHFGHCPGTFFRGLVQSICHILSSHHCSDFVFYAMYVSLCVALPYNITG